jgi:hypothetical protein
MIGAKIPLHSEPVIYISGQRDTSSIQGEPIDTVQPEGAVARRKFRAWSILGADRTWAKASIQ